MYDKLTLIYSHLDTLRSKFNNFFDSSKVTVKTWINSLCQQKCLKINQLLLIRELARQQKIVEDEEIGTQDSIHESSLSSLVPFQVIYEFSNLIKDVLSETDPSILEINEKLNSLFQEIENLKTKTSITSQPLARTMSSLKYEIQWSLIDQYQQETPCYVIASNQSGTRIATGSGNDIKIWDFEEGRLKPTKAILSEHQLPVTCLVFGGESGWLISGGLDNYIRSWKEVDEDDWRHKQCVSQQNQRHQNGITCLLFNHQENEVISSSYDQSIKVWHAEYQRNEIKFVASLHKHVSAVLCISLSKSEMHLVSCGQDKLIIVWEKNLGEWKFIQQIATKDFGYRVSFVNDDMIVWQQFNVGQTHIYQQSQGQFLEEASQQIPLNFCNQDESYFPSIFLKNEQLFVQKHNKFVYILKLLNNGKLTLSAEPIDCQDNKVYGCMAGNGKHLIIWIMKMKLFQVYEIKQ